MHLCALIVIVSLSATASQPGPKVVGDSVHSAIDKTTKTLLNKTEESIFPLSLDLNADDKNSKGSAAVVASVPGLVEDEIATRVSTDKVEPRQNFDSQRPVKDTLGDDVSITVELSSSSLERNVEENREYDGGNYVKEQNEEESLEDSSNHDGTKYDSSNEEIRSVSTSMGGAKANWSLANDSLSGGRLMDKTIPTRIETRKGEVRIGEVEQPQEPRLEDIVEAVDFGIQAMHDLHRIKEPKLYSMGLYLRADNPAKFVAAFNDQTEEASRLAKFGYAILQSASMFVNKFPDLSRNLPLSRNAQKTILQRQCPTRGTPHCPPASLRYRTSDGSCNNMQHLWWGSAMSSMQRFLPPTYHDGIQTIRRSRNGRPLPSAREVSELIHEDRDVPLASVTHMLMQWGQFVDHDLTATGQSRGFNGTVPQCCLNGGVGFQPPEFMHPECLPIAVNLKDSFYGQLGVRCLEFLRSGAAPKEDCQFGPREQLTQVTSYLDASTVYSSNAFQSDILRLFRNGLLQYGRIQFQRVSLPRQDSDICRQGSLSTSCFRAGDGRVSEQPALTSLHVVFLRLHNRIATKLAILNAHWSDEKVFQEARRIVGAILQHITYREFLPIVLGPEVTKIFDLDVLREGYYHGYNPSVNPTVANAFSTAAYRFGHSLVQHSFVRFNGNHRPLFNSTWILNDTQMTVETVRIGHRFNSFDLLGHSIIGLHDVSIHDEFQNPANLETPGSVDRLLLGLINQPSQRRDEFITNELTCHLFQTPFFRFGMDLASLNIQRGRDHGIPPYVEWREPCGLSPIKNFADLDRVMSPAARQKFVSLYANVEDIDLFPAGLAEKSVSGGLVGPTFACIIGQQFSNLRRGDRFWYENNGDGSSFTPEQLQRIRRITLAEILCRTMDNIETIQPFVFLVHDKFRNRRVSCDDPLFANFNFEPWIERSPFGINNLRKTKRKISDEFDATVDKTDLKREESRARFNVSTKDQTKILPHRTKPIN